MTEQFMEHQTNRVPSLLTPIASCVRLALMGALLGTTASVSVGGELPVPKSTFVTAGRADFMVAKQTLQVRQQSERAILNWQQFNVGSNHEVRFVQPSASAVALNRIDQANPSRIFGKVTANGQIYLLNRNGFVFGKNSTVNANTLIASTLNISDEVFERGLTKVIDQDGTAALTGNGEIYRTDEQGHRTKIQMTLEPGASIKTDATGRVILAAPSIVNQGEIIAPNGQIILAATGDKVYLQEASDNSDFRGLLVEVSTGGDVTNLGKLLTPHGNTTLVGFAVNQQGRISATTSVRANGSIKLLAREGASTRQEGDALILEAKRTTRTADLDDGLGHQSSLHLSRGSLTEATPDLADRTTAVDGQTQNPSRIDLMAAAISLESDATLRSHAGQVNITATQHPDAPTQFGINNDSRIELDEGAVIDVSGVKNVQLPVERNVVEVELRSNELRDAPLQRDGILYAQKVKVDLRKGTPIADILGALERIERTVAERSTLGGALNLGSEGEVIIRPHSLLDFSGGFLHYQSGYIATTQLLADGRLVDIGDADPNRLYEGILGQIDQYSARWNVARHWDLPGIEQIRHFEPGYIEGKSAGELRIQANRLLLDGELRGGARNGVYQREPTQRARGGSLTIDVARAPGSTQAVSFQAKHGAWSLGPGGQFPENPEHPGQPAPLILTPDFLKKSGIARADIKTNGQLHIQAGESVGLLPGGSLKLTGGETRVEGTIEGTSAQVDLNTHLTGVTVKQLSGAIELGSGAMIDVRGAWVNDRPHPSATPDTGPVFIDGGSVNLVAEGDVKLTTGSRIDVSGGAWRRVDHGQDLEDTLLHGSRKDQEEAVVHSRVVAGNAGSIAVTTRRFGGGTRLVLDGELEGIALQGGEGGSVALTANQVAIGSITAPLSSNGNEPSPLILTPEFFRRGGFRRYDIESNQDRLEVTAGSTISIRVPNRVLDPSYTTRVSGSDLAGFSQVKLLPEVSRTGGEISLSLVQEVAKGGQDAALVLAEGASIRTDAGGKIHLLSDTDIFIQGDLKASGGEITAEITPSAFDPGFRDDQGIWLGDQARLNASGAALVQSDALGRLEGKVLPGGRVALLADRGFVVAEPGAAINVSGIEAELDLPHPLKTGGLLYQRQVVASSGGTIQMRAAEGIQWLGNLSAQAGRGVGAAGGELTVELNKRTREEPDPLAAGQRAFPEDPGVIRIVGDHDVSPAPGGSDHLDLALGASIPGELFGLAEFDSRRVTKGGFSSLKLTTADRIEFQGKVDWRAERSIAFDAPVLSGEGESNTVSVQANDVTLGSTQIRPEDGPIPVGGESVLRVRANLIDLVGTTGLAGFGQAELSADEDLRLIGIRTSQLQRDLSGEFLMKGELTLKADQIYPTTLTDFRVAVTGETNGILTILPGDGSTPVFSAGGKLTLEAPTLLQGGVVKAPQGELTLKAVKRLELAPGSLTSNSLEGTVIPFGQTQGGLDWVYPLGTQNLVYAAQPQDNALAPPGKKLALEAQRVEVSDGAVIDTSGGGDLRAFEFVPGPGGSVDILNPQDPKYLDGSFSYQEKFAILPGYQGRFAPYDPLETVTAGLRVGDSLHWSGGGGIPAGEYVLLPAHYALLPGAYLVTSESETIDIVPGLSLRNLNGDPVVAGYRTVAGTKIREAGWRAFSIESNRVVKARAEYRESFANSFFSEQATQQHKTIPLLPRDAGRMLVSADSQLGLAGTVLAVAEDGGRSGRLDIVARDLAVISATSGAMPLPGVVNLLAEDLNQLGVSSIALGGVRSEEGGVTELEARADTVTLGATAELTGEEIILTAKKKVSIEEEARITAAETGTDLGPTEAFQQAGDGAFLRIAGGAQADFARTDGMGRRGSIRIQPGAVLTAPGSIRLDAVTDLELQGTLAMTGGSVALGANRISLGEVTDHIEGLVLSPATLQSLKVDELILNSAKDLSLFGGVDLDLSRLVIRTSGILGFDNAGQTAKLRADSILFENSGDVPTARASNGTGAIEFAARQIEFGAGTYALQGFNRARFEATERIVGTGAANLNAAADLDFAAAVWTGGAGAETSIDASGHAVHFAATQNPGDWPVESNLGGRLSMTADHIDMAGKIELPSGGITLNALNGDVVLRDGATLDVSGRELRFSQQTRATDGGKIDLRSATGDISVLTGSRLDLRGDRGGALTLSAPLGGVVFNGQAEARGSEQPGSFSLDVGALIQPPLAESRAAPLSLRQESQAVKSLALDSLTSQLQDSGFADAMAFRTRTGDLNLTASGVLSGRLLSLTADQGSVRIDGQLLATGEEASIQLHAGHEVHLGPTAQLLARGASDSAGQVLLEAVDEKIGTQSRIVLEDGAKISIAAVDGAANGRVQFRAMRTDDEVAIQGNLREAITGAATVTVEAVKTYLHEGTISAKDIAGWRADTESFMTQTKTIESRLGIPGGLRPGLEIRSEGDLRLGAKGWDLSDWRYEGRPGTLSLQAGAHLSFAGNLSDGFKAYDESGLDLADLLGAGARIPVKDLLQPGESWSYRFAAGGDITVGSGVMVRSGTGDITIEAGRDFILSDASAAVYTAGRPAETQRYGHFKNAFVAYQFYGEYPVEGGSIAISAGRDVRGARTGQFFDGWYGRIGNWSRNPSHQGETPTAWALTLGRPDLYFDGQPLVDSVFQQNIGALGGGDVAISAGRDVIDLSVMLPTTGMPVGAQARPQVADNIDFETNQVSIAGGGHLSVKAGNDVVGGTYYVGRGTARLDAIGSITASDGLGPVVALGDASFDLGAGQNISLAAAFNPTVVTSGQNTNFFFTYSDASALALTALSGQVVLQNDLAGLVDAVNELRSADQPLNLTGINLTPLSVYPASLDVAALQGDIRIEDSFVTYPSTLGTFNLLAGEKITSGQNDINISVTQSDADVELLPNVLYPAFQSFQDAAERLDPFGAASLTHAKIPVHRGDVGTARIEALHGGIVPNDPLVFLLAEPADIAAATDLRDASFRIQHPDDRTSKIRVGGDLVFTTPRDRQGNLLNLSRSIELSGPGQLWISAGGNVDLGASDGVFTLGNSFNTALAEEGASISLFAGMKTPPDFDGFSQVYDPTSEQYQASLLAYLRQRLGVENLEDSMVVQSYQTLSEDLKHEWILRIFFDELRAAAIQAAESGNSADYEPGFQAIDALFPGQSERNATKYRGDLQLFFSKIHTLDGGDINLLVPGGSINAGLAVSFSGAKPASELGIVAQRTGAISAFVDGDFQVNQSRVFALDGGDITLWSSNGDIDAGRGAKAALAVPPPRITFDEQGNLKIEFPPLVSGSGIRTACGTPEHCPPGNVYLAAPRGVVDAGEAGIGGNNIVIAATAVIGASNIDVGGVSTGVPVVAVAPPVTSAGAANAAASAAQAAEQSASSSRTDDAAQREALAKANSGLLNFELVGFGDCSVSDVREGKPGCG